MLENKFVDEYKKIKPSDELKTRIFYSVLEAEAKREKRPLYLRLRPVLSGALACVVLLCCMAVIPFEHLEEGDVSVFYAQSGEFIAPSHPMGRSYGIALCDDTYYEYAQMPNGCTGAEFTFEFGGKTQLKTDFGSIYQKNADGSYSELGEKTRLDGSVTVFWAMPTGDSLDEAILTIKNRSGEMRLSLEALDGAYKANLALTE